MRYPTQPRFTKYGKGYGLLSFSRKFGNKCRKCLVDTATKTGIDPAKTESKTIVQKTAEATGDLLGNKISHKITSIGKPNQKEISKTEDIYIPPEKRQQIIHDLRLFWKMWHYSIRKEFQKVVNFPDTAFDNKDLPKFVTKKWIEIYDQSAKKYKPNKKIGIKT